jgi:hypothetical protein
MLLIIAIIVPAKKSGQIFSKPAFLPHSLALTVRNAAKMQEVFDSGCVKFSYSQKHQTGFFRPKKGSNLLNMALLRGF